MKTIEITTSLAGPFYAFPASQTNFANWSTKRVPLNGANGRFSGSVNTTVDGAKWLVFNTEAAPTNWNSWIARADFTLELSIESMETNFDSIPRYGETQQWENAADTTLEVTITKVV
jgi:hypothetical protein